MEGRGEKKELRWSTGGKWQEKCLHPEVQHWKKKFPSAGHCGGSHCFMSSAAQTATNLQWFAKYPHRCPVNRFLIFDSCTSTWASRVLLSFMLFFQFGWTVKSGKKKTYWKNSQVSKFIKTGKSHCVKKKEKQLLVKLHKYALLCFWSVS